MTNSEDSGKIKVSEAISGALNPYSPRAIKHAERYYESVRKMKTDVKRMSDNTSWSEDVIQKIKDYVFNETHELFAEVRRFDPSYDMTVSWQNLIQGGEKIAQKDIVLLKHGYSQDETNIFANKKHIIKVTQRAIKHMVKLKNIKKDGDVMSCDYYPEHSSFGGYIKFDMKNDKVVEHILSQYAPSSKMYPSQVIGKMYEIWKSKENIPTEAFSIWY